MNATAWSSLSGLCKHLGKEGKCVVEETERGWYITYIDRDPKAKLILPLSLLSYLCADIFSTYVDFGATGEDGAEGVGRH